MLRVEYLAAILAHCSCFEDRVGSVISSDEAAVRCSVEWLSRSFEAENK